MRRYLLPLVIAGVLLVPVAASAVSWFPIVQCGATGQVACNPCDLFKTFKNVIDLVLYGITGPIAAFVIVWAGGMMLLGGAKPVLYEDGKKLLRNTLIGVTIILASWLFTNTLIKTLAKGNDFDTWYQFSCPLGVSAIPPIETVLPAGGPAPVIPPAVVLTAKNAGVATIGSTASLCATDLRCPPPGTCSALSKYTSKYGNNKLLQAVMLNESSCRINPPSSGAGAYGLMQLKPETAARFRAECNLYTEDKSGGRIPDTIDAGWLQSEVNVEKVICVASKFLDSLVGACGSEPRNLAAGYNGGPGACRASVDCNQTPSCSGGAMQAWECPWDDVAHRVANKGYNETRIYAPKVAVCAR